MRYLHLLLSLCLLVCVSCNDVWKRSDNTKRFIPGTYVKEVKNEFLFGHDTLIIQCTAGNNYLIVNRTSYQRIRENKILPQRFSELDLSAVYDEKSQNLYEQRLGKTFSFDPANKRLFEGGSQYDKVIP